MQLTLLCVGLSDDPLQCPRDACYIIAGASLCQDHAKKYLLRFLGSKIPKYDSTFQRGPTDVIENPNDPRGVWKNVKHKY